MQVYCECMYCMYFRRGKSQQKGGCEEKDSRISDACRAHFWTAQRQHGSELHSKQGQCVWSFTFTMKHEASFTKCPFLQLLLIDDVKANMWVNTIYEWVHILWMWLKHPFTCCSCFVLYYMSSLKYFFPLVFMFLCWVSLQALGSQCCGGLWAEQTHSDELKHYRVLGIIDKVHISIL